MSAKEIERLARLKDLKRQVNKLRCWLTGFKMGRNDQFIGIPGEESLRMVEIFLEELIQKEKKK
jgi:hypothetical protein